MGSLSYTSSTLQSTHPLLSHIAVGLSTLLFGYWFARRRTLAQLDLLDDLSSSEGSDEGSVDLTDGDKDKMGALRAGLMEECKLVLLVRTDLKMDKGKMAAQCCHATLACYKHLLSSNPTLLKHWERIGQAKVALKCPTEEEMNNLEARARSLGLCARSIRDAGRTQVAAGSKTVLGIGPGPVKLVDSVTGHLKLL